jgi:hypothetical protein
MGLHPLARRGKVNAMTRKTTTDLDTSPVDETTRLRRIASRHGLSEEGLVEFVADIRRHARNRRRRLSDSQIEALVSDLGDRP